MSYNPIARKFDENVCVDVELDTAIVASAIKDAKSLDYNNNTGEWTSGNKTLAEKTVQNWIKQELARLRADNPDLDDNLKNKSRQAQDAIYGDLLRICGNNVTVPPLNWITGDQLSTMEIPKTDWLVDEFLPAIGIAMVDGMPKIGKSWYLLQTALAVATGKPFFGHSVKQGSVLYLDLEGNEGQTQQRHYAITQQTKIPAALYTVYSSVRTLNTGLIDQLEMWVNQADTPRLIIIDTFAKIADLGNSRQDAYTQSLVNVSPLEDFAKDHKLLIMTSHHLTKAAARDWAKRGEMAEETDYAGGGGHFGSAQSAIVINGDLNSPDRIITVSGRCYKSKIRLAAKVGDHGLSIEGDYDEVNRKKAIEELRRSPVFIEIKQRLVKSAKWEIQPTEFTQLLAEKYRLVINPAMLHKMVFGKLAGVLANECITAHQSDGGQTNKRKYTFEKPGFAVTVGNGEQISNQSVEDNDNSSDEVDIDALLASLQ